MKRTNGQITTALSNATNDLNKAAIALNVGLQWLKRQKAKKGL